MNCCGHNHNDTKQGKSKKHMWMMALCCGVPVLILLALPLLRGVLPGAASVIGAITPFLCPVMMIAMMFMMSDKGRKGGHDCGSNDDECKEERT